MLDYFTFCVLQKVARHLRKPAGGSSKSDAPQVEWKDQQKLNAYGVLVQQAEALNDELKQAKVAQDLLFHPVFLAYA